MMQKIMKPIRLLFGIGVAEKKKKEIADVEKKIQDDDFQVESMYMTLSEAKEEIWRRWNNKELRKKVEDYLGEIPEVLKHEPRAVFARHVITPNAEYSYFHDLALMSGLKPLGWEYCQDKFFTVNLEKLHLGKVIFFEKGKIGIQSKKIVNFKDQLEGKKLSELKTIWGECLIDFHHGLCSKLDIADIEKLDASSWYKFYGENAEKNYRYFLSLFICSGILFENFLLNRSDEARFTRDVVIPASKFVYEKFGVRPLIVPLISRKDESEMAWLCHPIGTLDIINKKNI